MMVRRNVILQMEVPEGASHYSGFLPDEAKFYRLAQVSPDRSVDRAWLLWEPHRKEWAFVGFSRPDHLKEIQYASA